MPHPIKRVFYVVIGAVSGFSLGLILGHALGSFIGSLLGILGFTIGNNQIAICGFIGLVCGAIIGYGFLSLGNLGFSTKYNLVWGLFFCSMIGLAIGISAVSDIPEILDFLGFWGLGQNIGLYVGGTLGFFLGSLIAFHASKKTVLLSEEELRNNANYAQYLKNRTSPK